MKTEKSDMYTELQDMEVNNQFIQIWCMQSLLKGFISMQ